MIRLLRGGVLCLAAAALAPNVLHAQAPSGRTITLQEAIALALVSGSSVEVARSARDAARQRDRAFNARLLPQLFVSGNAANYNRSINPITLPDGSQRSLPEGANATTVAVAGTYKH